MTRRQVSHVRHAQITVTKEAHDLPENASRTRAGWAAW